ncbi:uncharacterized protein CTHT_0026050 [Thermochaetoides thermophila DSM 1495]|uniref:Uncharacterized protein n=1 Tax=Chaetomium thermophilum (strain DSM 1495 / CBS 144.50 / IMI 039719) TaxID=759272 RepID=G0S6A4_CHATD|nr:hypothetical protein CTHT_0026050 [Thermochaetoides thermophila DSM 1495]EGS20768.1 hypothetical protein CTHT_0026050 [Thermochaetoides thermophila DSM 1495]
MKANGETEGRELTIKVGPQATVEPVDAEIDEQDAAANGILGSPIEEMAKFDDDGSDASDDEFLSIKPKRKSSLLLPGSSKSVVASSSKQPATPSSSTSKREHHRHHGNTEDDYDDPLFEVEDIEAERKEQKKYIQDDDDDHTPSLRLRTLAREEQIQREAGIPPEQLKMRNGTSGSQSWKPPPVSPSAVLFGHSIGSYKGRSVTINPIKDPQLYDEIAKLKDVHFWVGSVDGRSGIEPADMGSYRAANRNSIIGQGGVPMSFTQRLALEEEMERRRLAGEKLPDEE